MSYILEFDWNESKAISNKNKHGISFSEAATIFADPLELTISDPDHSFEEYRFISIGRSKAGNLLTVSYTERQPNIIRIISCRSVTKQEKKFYEQSD